MNDLSTYIIEKLKINKSTKTILSKNEFIQYIQEELNGNIDHIENDSVDVYLISTDNYDVDNTGHAIPRFEFELENNCFRPYGDLCIIKDEDDVDNIDGIEEIEEDVFERENTGGYKYSIKNAEMIIKLLKEV